MSKGNGCQRREMSRAMDVKGVRCQKAMDAKAKRCQRQWMSKARDVKRQWMSKARDVKGNGCQRLETSRAMDVKG